MRFSISLKLILAAIVLVALITAGFVLVGGELLDRVYEAEAERLQRVRTSDLEQRSVAVARHVGDTAREALAGSEAGRLHRTLQGIVGEDAEIRRAAIADETGRLLARSDQPVVETLRSGERVEPTDQLAIAERVVGDRRLREIVYPIRAEDGEAPLGYLQLLWSLEALDQELSDIAEQKRDRLQAGRELVLLAGLIAIGAGVLAGVLGGVALSRPVRRLVRTARQLALGNLSARSDVTSRDEIGELADTINHMAGRIGGLLEETRRHAELQQELTVARGIQEALLPERKLIERPGLTLCGAVEAASHCGGDWWAFARLTRQRTLILVGDVTGHGLSSAMLTATAKSCLDTVNQLTRGDFRVGYLLRVMDQLLREGIGDTFHMTCFAAILDPIEGRLTYANAGHNHPYLLRDLGAGSWRQGRLAGRGNRLGDADGYAFIEHTIAVQPGDLICWYTDGLVEPHGDARRGFGARRLRAALARHATKPPDALLNAILAAFRDFHGPRDLDDDLTCVVARVLPDQENAR